MMDNNIKSQGFHFINLILHLIYTNIKKCELLTFPAATKTIHFNIKLE